jgi:hypothetical protein
VKTPPPPSTFTVGVPSSTLTCDVRSQLCASETSYRFTGYITLRNKTRKGKNYLVRALLALL